MGIRSMMVIGIASLLLLAGSISAYITAEAVHREAIDRVTISQRHYVELLARALMSDSRLGSKAERFAKLHRRRDVIHLHIVDQTLRRLDEPSAPRAPASARVLDAFRTGQGEYIRDDADKRQFFSRRVRLTDGRDVVLDVGFNLQMLEESLARRLQVVLTYLIGSFGAVLLFGVYLSRRILVLPLQRLTSMANAIQADQITLSTLPAIRGPAEIRQLANAIAALLTRLRDKNQDLQTNIIALQNAQNELLHAEQLAAVGRLSAGVAHEVGNPLAAALGFVEFLKTSEGLDGLTADLCVRIERELLRIQATLRQLLDTSRPSTGHRSRVSLTALINSSMARLRHHRKMRAVEVRVSGLDAELTIETQSFEQS
ncbi:MAG: histidine kinase dimerization/phospho-acceptor domain-containing protein, partial [Myxococcota bacterium]|nr:histidine kinase dimerization/phospho-acceptor domain-containing protein [Myxococcota bacterium]